MRNLLTSTNTIIYNQTTELSQPKNNEKAAWIWIITLLGPTALLFMAICILSVQIKSKVLQLNSYVQIDRTLFEIMWVFFLNIQND